MHTWDMPGRTFPFSPRSAAKLALGDLLAIPCDDGTWGVLQVSGLESGARSTFHAGVLRWRGQSPPTSSDIDGLEFVEHGLTPIGIFKHGGVEVVGTAALAAGIQSNLNEFSVGSTHKVWGWRTAMNRARSAVE